MKLRLSVQYSLIFAGFTLAASIIGVLSFAAAARFEGAAARQAGETVVRDALDAQLRVHADSLTELLARQLTDDLYFLNVPQIGAALHAVRAQSGVTLVYAVDAQGRPIADAPDVIAQIAADAQAAELIRYAIATGADSVAQNDRRLEIVKATQLGGHIVGGVRLTFDLSVASTELTRVNQQIQALTESAVRRAVTSSAAAAAFAALLGVFGGVLAASRLVRPINRLARYAQQIGRAPEVAGPPPFRRQDELGDLAEAMGLMAAALSARETALRGAKEAADHAAHAKSAFLATISHEIRTPINAILGMGHLMEEAGLPERQSALLGRLRAAARTLADLVNDILDFSKVDAGKLVLEHAPFDLRRVIDGALDLVRTRADEKGVALQAVVDPGLPTALIGDPLRLGQILTNLLSNAVKFTDHGVVRVTAAATDGPVGDGELPDLAIPDKAQGVDQAAPRIWLTLTVIDDGCGMTQEQAATIFDAFAQADASTARRYGGVGLGLSIVTRFVEAMGGAIRLETALGVGSRFSVSIPLDVDAAPPEEDAPLPAALDGAAVRAALDRLGVDRNRYIELLRRFIARHSNSGRDVLAALANGDRDAARHLAHAARGAAGMLGAVAAHDAAAQLERALVERSEGVDALARRFAAAISELSLAASALTGAMRANHAQAPESLDWATVRAVVARFDQQLTLGDAAAEETLTELRPLLGSVAAADLDGIGRALDAFEFDEARRRLKSLSTRLAL